MSRHVASPQVQLDLGFARRGSRTVLERRVFSWPFVIARGLHLDTTPAHLLTTIVQTGSGALHGEDRLVQRIAVGSGAAAHVTTQGASPVHRARPGETAHETVKIAVAPDGFLEYLPEPRILFADAALEQVTLMDCAPGAGAILSDGFTLHDPGGTSRGLRSLAMTLDVRRGSDEPVLLERLAIRGLGHAERAGFRAFGSLILATPASDPALEALSVRLTASLASVPDLYAAAGLLADGAGLAVRFSARSLEALRWGQTMSWHAARKHLFGRNPSYARKCT